MVFPDRISQVTGADRRGFSLVELLVAVGVIALLLVLSVSISSSISQGAKAARCLSHLRESGVLIRALAVDRRGSVPLFHYSGPGSSRTWPDFLVEGGYLERKSSIQLCPSAHPRSYLDRGSIYGVFVPTAMELPQLPHHYRPSEGADAGTLFVRLNTVEEASRYWLLADSWQGTLRKQHYVISESEGRVHLRHRGVANFLFADGHVRSLKGQEIRNLPHAALRRGFDAHEQLIEF